MRAFVCTIIAVAVSGLVGPVVAQEIDIPAAQQKLLSKRAAEADAYRKLAECIKGLQINSETYVKDFVAESDVIQTALDEFIKGVRLGEPRWYEDMTCEVPAEVTVARVIETLKEIHTRHYKGDRVKGSDIVQMNRTVERQVIKVIGMGAPRVDLPPGLPEGVEEVLTPAPADLPAPPIPALWRRIPPRERLMAIQAAERDAQRKLLERIQGLRITSDTLVRDFVTESDVIQTAAQGMLSGYERKRVYLHHDEPIVEVTGTVPVESVIAMIKEIHSRSIQGSRIKGTDIEEVTRTIQRQTFEATGMGVPRPQALQEYAAQAAATQPIPPWALSPIRKEGNGVPPADKAGTAQGKLLAARAAELDAKRKLVEHIQGLRIDSSTAIRDFVTQYDDIHSQVDAFLVGAMIESTEFDGDMATVTVGLPGMQVWQVIHERIRITRLEPGTKVPG